MGVPRSVRKASKAYADQMVEHILAWAKGDLYNQTRTYPKYTILEEEKFWKPTPPDYMDGIEPHWNKIRTLVLDSASQYKPKDPLAFDLTKGSPFQTQLQQVYEIGEGLTEEQIEIAKFWDCNPYVTHHRGHAMFATKKLPRRALDWHYRHRHPKSKKRFCCDHQRLYPRERCLI